MRIIRLIVSELLGLFVDDEFLAIAILILAAFTASLAFALAAPKLYVGILLVGGCIAIVAGSLVRAVRRLPRSR